MARADRRADRLADLALVVTAALADPTPAAIARAEGHAMRFALSGKGPVDADLLGHALVGRLAGLAADGLADLEHAIGLEVRRRGRVRRAAGPSGG